MNKKIKSKKISFNNKRVSKKYEQAKKDILDNVCNFIEEKKDNIEEIYSFSQIKYNNYIKDITNEEYLKYLVKVSVVILTANEYEEKVLNYGAFSSRDKDNINNPILRINVEYNKIIRFTAYILNINNYVVLHLHAQNTGSYTFGGSGDLVRYVVENELIHPTCIISYGICFGHDNYNQKLGDVIIAEKIYPYFMGVKLSDGTWQVKSHNYILNMRQTCNELYDKIEDLNNNQKFKILDSEVYFGNIITGEAVISDGFYKDIMIKASHIIDPKGGDMEGYGLAKECFTYNIPCMLIKSICDWGNQKNIDQEISQRTKVKNAKDKIQAYTSNCAFNVLKIMFENEIFEKSEYEEYKKSVIEKFDNKCTCLMPIDDLEKAFYDKYNTMKKSYSFKKLTKVYIEKVCEVLEQDEIIIKTVRGFKNIRR